MGDTPLKYDSRLATLASMGWLDPLALASGPTPLVGLRGWLIWIILDPGARPWLTKTDAEVQQI